MKSDHLSVVSFGKLRELQRSLCETFDLLKSFQAEKLTFLRDDKLGYLSEKGTRLGDNFHVKFELTLHSVEEADALTRLAKEFAYSHAKIVRNSFPQ